MRNTKYKLYHDKSLQQLHNDLNICGAVRNHFIALSKRYYRRYGKGLAYGRMSKHLTKLKKLEKYKYWNIPFSWALQNIIKRLAQSFRETKILKRGCPKFKKCKKHKGMTFSGKYIKLEKIINEQKNQRKYPTYKIRLNGNWYKFSYHREIRGLIKEVYVKRDPLGDIYITICEDFAEIIPEPKTGKAEGFDMGIKDFLTGSDGKRYISPMFYKQDAEKLAVAQRRYARKVKGSKNSMKALEKVVRVHKKMANKRSDHHWKLAIELCREYDILFFEDLNIEGMKQLWGKQISDLAFTDFFQKLKHQAKKRIKSVIKIGKWQPTTKKCSICEYKNGDLILADRSWICPNCNTKLDRDQNAAINILQEGVASYGLAIIRPIVRDFSIIGCCVDATSGHLKSSNAFV